MKDIISHLNEKNYDISYFIYKSDLIDSNGI